MRPVSDLIRECRNRVVWLTGDALAQDVSGVGHARVIQRQVIETHLGQTGKLGCVAEVRYPGGAGQAEMPHLTDALGAEVPPPSKPGVVALDAAARGLSVALVERDDFAAGTSSRSTTLVHGGVRYLEAALAHFDRAQFHLVREALAERATLLRIAPHLVHPLRTVVPVYSPWQALFYRTGLWLYDRAVVNATGPGTDVLRRLEDATAAPLMAPSRGTHIVPWREDRSNRLNPRNGLCLSAIHDKAFDRHLFTLDDTGRVGLSQALKKTSDAFLRDVFWPAEGTPIEAPERFAPDPELMARHREFTMSANRVQA